MSADAPKIEASAQGEQQQQHPAHTQEQHDQDDQASVTSKPGQDNDNNNDTAGASDEKAAAKPNPLKKLGAVFKTVFACLRKPAVRNEDEASAAKAQQDRDAGAAAGGDDDEEEEGMKKGGAAGADAAESHTPVVAGQAPVIEQGVLSGGQSKEGAPHS